MNSDLKDLLQLLTEEQVEYLANGGYAVGRPPCQLDFLTSVPGLDFEDCWPDRVIAPHEGIEILFLGKADLIRSKQVAGRPQDLADIDELMRT